MKRAAVEWGVGRYLYGMTQVWVKIVQRGKGFFIVDEEQPKLDKAHEDWVQKIRAKQSPQPQGGQGQYDLQVSQAEENAAQLEQKRAQHDSLTAETAELEARRTTGFDGTSLREKLPDLYARHEEQLRAKTYQSKYTQALADTQARIDTLKKEVSRQKYIVAGLKPGVQCPMCKQTVTEATLPKVKQEFQTSVESLSRQGEGADRAVYPAEGSGR